MKANWLPLTPDTETRKGESVVYLGVFADAVKIGISINPKERLRSLSTTSGRMLERAFILMAEQAYDARRAEMDLHARFSSIRLEGEWFLPQAIAAMKAPIEVNQIDGFAEGADSRVTDQFARFGFKLLPVATADQVREAQIWSVKVAFIPIMAEIMVALSETAAKAEAAFEVKPGMSGSDVLMAWSALIEKAGGLHHSRNLGDVLDRIANEATYYSEDEFVSGLTATHPSI
ncbi:GIY-YIG nuclease family protein [Paracoccus sp. DMF-8]|uniref:GIY-YIG nuclease family protein n=1 Tax=Paracoccus sp. DMF-8 TaxID=3019445 RepID=UPI0023E7B6E0|nr:GIY-YIG nuclease family protein [Paracoccus sp. DMF-8]MDF3606334.1 GIY-YIG nuclease family protein [Paracoccus sp. DMF-8]